MLTSQDEARKRSRIRHNISRNDMEVARITVEIEKTLDAALRCSKAKKFDRRKYESLMAEYDRLNDRITRLWETNSELLSQLFGKEMHT